MSVFQETSLQLRSCLSSSPASPVIDRKIILKILFVIHVLLLIQITNCNSCLQVQKHQLCSLEDAFQLCWSWVGKDYCKGFGEEKEREQSSRHEQWLPHLVRAQKEELRPLDSCLGRYFGQSWWEWSLKWLWDSSSSCRKCSLGRKWNTKHAGVWSWKNFALKNSANSFTSGVQTSQDFSLI